MSWRTSIHIPAGALIIALAAGAAGLGLARQHGAQHEHGQVAPAPPASALSTPASIQQEHKHLHHQLEAALAAGGKTAEKAKAVADVLASHFEHEEAFAMPPLGLLEPLARKQPVDEAQSRQAIEMAARLRAEYDAMLEEHEALTEALHALAAAAGEEGKPEHAHFAEALIAHAQHEEQILYPATLLVGEYLKRLHAHDQER